MSSVARVALGVAVALCSALPARAQVTERTEGLRALHLLGAALQERASVPGFAIAIADSSGIVFSEAFGVADIATRAPTTPLTRWRIGSVSKSFTAAGAMLLASRGALDVDASVASLLPDWSGRPGGAATPRQLAGHLGGIRHYREGEGISYTHYDDVVTALHLFADDSLVAAPGREYSYSTYGYSLLSAVMQAAAREPFLAWMERNVFAPLGMHATGADNATRIIDSRASFYEIDDGRLVPAPFTDNSYKWAGGGFLSTPEDMVRFGRALRERQLLDGAAVATLFTSQRTSSGEETGYGMGFRPDTDHAGRRIVHHGGSSEGGRAFLLIVPDEGVVVALAANRSTAPLFEEEALALAHFVTDEHATGGNIDEDLAGTWSLRATLGDDTVDASLRLYKSGIRRGILEWSADQTPIDIVVVDRHGEELQLVGVGPHGVMNAWLRASPAGWSGPWEYRGRSGTLGILPHIPPRS